MKWEKVVFGDVLKIVNGKNQKKVVDPNGKYPIYGSGGIMGYANDFICPEETTIIGRKGSINNPIFVKEKFWNVDTAFGLCAGDKLDKKYLYYFCTTYNFLKHNKATTLPSLTKVDLLKIQIPLPPLTTQKRIAAILDAADEYRQKTKTLIKKYDQLAQSLFMEMFGDPSTNPKNWRKVTLNNECSKISVGFVGVTEPFYTIKENGVPMIRTGNLGEGFLKIDNLKYVTKEFHEKQKKSQLVKGDILIARHGDNGKAVLYNGEFSEANCLNIVIMRPNNSLNCIYVQFLLNSDYFRNVIAGRTGGATQKVVNTKEIQKLIIPLQCR
jgi:type I restriction enzyme S subunit